MRAHARARACSLRTYIYMRAFLHARRAEISAFAPAAPPSMLPAEGCVRLRWDIAKKSSRAVRKKSKRGLPAMSCPQAWADGGLKMAEFAGSVAQSGSRGGPRNQDFGACATPRDATPGERRILPGQIIGPIIGRALTGVFFTGRYLGAKILDVLAHVFPGRCPY